MPDLIPEDQIQSLLKKFPDWEHSGKSIERTFEFEDFTEAIDFVNGIAEIAEDADHHPDIDIRYSKVRLQLSTHSKGGLTPLDVELAGKIDSLFD